MVKADDRILEYLDMEEPHSPKRIADDERIQFKTKHVNVRLLKLAEAGLVQKSRLGRGVYEITDKGRGYLAGELDATELPEPDE